MTYRTIFSKEYLSNYKEESRKVDGVNPREEYTRQLLSEIDQYGGFDKVLDDIYSIIKDCSENVWKSSEEMKKEVQYILDAESCTIEYPYAFVSLIISRKVNATVPFGESKAVLSRYKSKTIFISDTIGMIPKCIRLFLCRLGGFYENIACMKNDTKRIDNFDNFYAMHQFYYNCIHGIQYRYTACPSIQVLKSGILGSEIIFKNCIHPFSVLDWCPIPTMITRVVWLTISAVEFMRNYLTFEANVLNIDKNVVINTINTIDHDSVYSPTPIHYTTTKIISKEVSMGNQTLLQYYSTPNSIEV